MKEFGSDFHYIPTTGQSVKTIGELFPDAMLYADGRQALIALYRQMGWKRLWVPGYFCYEVLETMAYEGINLVFYDDYPLNDDKKVILSLPFVHGDALLRVNYFGLRTWRSNVLISIPVVEDHTHDLIGPWAANSNADWCIASLRKTLPLAEGGILWSPKHHRLHEEPEHTDINKELASIRWNAMKKKSLYLDGELEDKSKFRHDMVMTEEQFDTLPTSALDEDTKSYLQQFDIVKWYEGKKDNWRALKDMCSSRFTVMEPEESNCYPFSFTLLFNSESERNDFRKSLIDRRVYPALLWNVPGCDYTGARDFSCRMLSIHCDSRYNEEAINELRGIIEAI